MMVINKSNLKSWLTLILVLSIPARWIMIIITKIINLLTDLGNPDLLLFLSYLEAPGTVGILLLLYKWFDISLWHQPIFRKLGLVSLPDMRGRWEGTIKSSHDEHKASKPVVVEIVQSSSDVSVAMYSKDSKSESVIEGFLKKKSGQYELRYEYRNEPKANAVKTMHKHNGVARLKPHPDKRMLEGTYYTSHRDRTTEGIISLKFKGYDLLGRFEA